MMATSQNIKEYEKGTKKTFASPTQKSHHVKPQADSWKEDPQGTSSLEAEAKPRRPRASPKKEQKTATEHGPNGGQEKKRKAQDKPAKKKGKEKQTLTNAEFEEIFQIVLRKSLQEYLGLGSGLNFAETSCVQPIIPTKSDKEPGIASPATDNENADGEEVIVPDTREIASSLEEEVDSEIRTSKPGQLAAEPSKKKSNRLSLSKRRKKSEDEKMEEIQDGYECILKDKQKTTIQDPSQIRGQQKEEEGGFDLNYNRCDIPEETWTGCESDVAYASYVPGSIVWAKQYGYPWWPGMIETDPDLGEYFLFSSHLDSLPSKYHVTYFGERVSRAWIPVSMLKNFQELSLELVRGERVNLFGFRSRYSGSDSSGEGKGPKKKFKAPESKASATTLPEKQEIKIVSKCPTPPAGHGVCRLGKEGPGPQEPLTQEAAIFPLEDDGSSDLDLEQLMEDIGETEERGESQQRDGSEGFLAALFEE
ncbi:Zinc finger CW-type PWWP domain protein 1-like [Cricetulus griseus]|uniref:Zinc finger CW-type PWWP domain protein 1 n=1 Tax=Cricetulus griseus TaxID=10029 RepID=G3I650_CRIGR|nr:Zinc finger CW-type PWWP domain protein 1-like [Cricetulus griseus]ERE76139.1 zinc finger CW-type PWWP domain protein 1 [Cricetulus griseus]